MLSKLFRSRARFDNPDPESRRRSIAALSDEDAATFQADLAELAASDPSIDVRKAALTRLTDAAKLDAFLTSSDADLARIAAEGIAVHGTDPNRFSAPQIRNAAIRAARDPESVLMLVGDVGYDAELVQLAVDSKHAKVRLAAADKLVKESSLVELERASRDRDKNVNRLARTRLDAIRHARADVEKSDRRAHELLRSLESQLKGASSDPLFAAKLGVFRSDWSTNRERHRQNAKLLESHGATIASLDAMQTQFDALLHAAETALPPPQATAPPADSTPAVPSVASANDEPFAESLAALVQLHKALASGVRDVVAEYDQVHDQNVAEQDRWLAAADHAPPPEHLAKQFHEVTHALKLLFDAAVRVRALDHEIRAIGLIDVDPNTAESPEQFEQLWSARQTARNQSNRLSRLLDQMAWPAGHALPATIAVARTARESLIALDAAIDRQLDDAVSRMTANIADLSAAISDGNLGSAAGLEAEGRRLLRCLPGSIAKRMQGEFNALAARVIEMKDWVTYATHPKREELTDAMEHVAQTPVEPALQAEKIRELREAWRSLGPVTNHADRRLFDRFNAAAEIAFAPCRAYFEEQGNTRKFNLEQRRKICDELNTYLEQTDWANADWRAAERILHAARDEWRKYHPVDRSPGRKVQTRFEGLTNRLFELLKAEWERNIAIKQAIVTDSKAVLDTVTDMRDATDRIKTLQRHWREVGITPRRVDQTLWREFRAICDAVFGRREAVQQEVRQVTASHVSQAEALLDEYQSVFDGSGPGNADPTVARDFADRFNAFHELPRDALRRLEGRFREIDKNYRVLLRQARHRRATAGIDRLERIDAALCNLEVEHAAAPLSRDAIDARLQAVEDWQEHAMGPFTARVSALRGEPKKPSSSGPSAAQRRLALAIEMEIVAGFDTPPEDQQRRLALQVERLNQKHRQALDDDPAQMAERWCRTGPVDRSDDALRTRFFAACRHTIG